MAARYHDKITVKMLDLDALVEDPSATTVTWGPFPLRRVRLLAGLGLLVVAIFVGFIGTLRDSLHCVRRGPQSGQCQFRDASRADRSQSFAISSLQSISVKRTETHNRGRSTPHGQVVLVLGDRQIEMRTESPEAAAEHAAALRAFLAHGDMDRIDIATERVWGGYIFCAFMGLFGGGLLYSAAAGRRRFRCTYDGVLRQLSVVCEWPFGIASSTKLLPLSQPIEVEIDWGRVEDFFTSTRSPGPPGGRLWVRPKNGDSMPLDSKLWFGYNVHLRAAERLRVLLHCPRRTLEERQRVLESYEAARPRPAPQWSTAGGKLAVAWLGACTGSLVGLFITATIAVVFRFQKASDSAGGFWFVSGVLGGVILGIWLAFRVTQRADER